MHDWSPVFATRRFCGEYIIQDNTYGVVNGMKQFLDEQTREITEYDDQLVRRLIERITVCDERVVVEFKSDASVEVRR